MFGSANDFGIFSGSGVEEHFVVQQEPLSPEGATFRLNCPNCGNAQLVTIEWQQIADAAQAAHTQRLPIDPVTRLSWLYDGQSRRMYPQVGCVVCRHLVGPSITPDEASRLLVSGEQSGFVRRR